MNANLKSMLMAVIVASAMVLSATMPANAKRVIELLLADIHPIDNSMNRVNQAWAKWIEKESGGRVKIIILAAETAGKGADLYDAARTDIVDIACQFLVMSPGRFPLNEVMELPLLFSSARAAGLTHLALHEKYPALRDEFREVKVLGFHTNGPAQVHTLKRPIRELADWKGQINVGWGPYAAQIITAFGGTPEMIGPPELYDALSKKVVDGCLVEWEGLHVWNYNEVVRYSTEANIFLSPFVHVMNKDRFDSLPADIQDLLSGDAAKRYYELLGYQFDQEDAKFKASLSAHYAEKGWPPIQVLSDAEREKWEKAVIPIYEEWIAVAEAKGAPGRAILEDAKKFSKQFESTPCTTCEETLKAWNALK